MPDWNMGKLSDRTGEKKQPDREPARTVADAYGANRAPSAEARLDNQNASGLSNTEPDRSFGEKAWEWFKETHLSQGSTLAENGKALFRQGRTDLLDTLWGSPLANEPGVPGTPTMGMVTDAIQGNDKDHDHDR